MLFRISLIFSFFILFSCTNEKKITDSKFKDALIKIHQCEAYNELKYSNENAKFQEDCKQAALKELNISKENFETSMNYYTKHPKEFEALYDTLLLKYP
jgi:hypothetical protein